MALGPRALWQKASTSVAQEVNDEVKATLEEISGAVERALDSMRESLEKQLVSELEATREQLAATERQLGLAYSELQTVKAELAALRRAVGNDFAVANELAVLQGRRIRSVEGRIGELEERVDPQS